MKKDYRDILRPDIIRTVSGLALISRVIVDGYMSGGNHSRRVGSGMEFSQYRSYQTGDDLRLLDWKMLARSGRYYIKQSEIETNITVKFILDASKSMLHEENGLSKMDHARIITASLAYLAQTQGDAVGLFALNNNKLHAVYPKVQKQHFNRLLTELLAIESEGRWPSNSKNLKELHDRAHKELIIFISDMHEHDDEIIEFLTKLKTSRNEVLLLHIMGGDEMDFNYKGNVTFEDLETGVKLKVNANDAKGHYLKSLNDTLKSTKEALHANGISYHLFRLDGHIGESLKFFLKKRLKLL